MYDRSTKHDGFPRSYYDTALSYDNNVYKLFWNRSTVRTRQDGSDPGGRPAVGAGGRHTLVSTIQAIYSQREDIVLLPSHRE